MPRKDSKRNRGYATNVNDLDVSKDYMEYMRVVLRGKKDPVWWVEEVLGVKTLFPFQKKLFRTFYQNRYDDTLEQIKKAIIVAGMRSGKTAWASMMGCYEFWDCITMNDPAEYYKLLNKQPIFISVISTSEKQAMDGVYGNIANMIEASEWFNTWFDIGVANDKITCDKKNVALQTLSSWVTTGVGRSNRAVIFDELDSFENTSGKRGAWEMYSRLAKSTDTFGKDGHVVAISSPQTPTGIMMTLYKQALEEKGAIGLLAPTWEMNPNLTKEALMEEHKHDLAAFWRDYGCQPSVWSALQFPEGVRLDHINNVLLDQDVVSTDVYRVMAIDPAVRNDAFGVAVGYKPMFGKIIIDGVRNFRRTEGEVFIRPSELSDFIFKAIDRLNVGALVYDTWMFPELIEKVGEQKGIECVKHIVLKEDYDRWRELQNSPDDYLSVVYDDDLKIEANDLVIVNTGSSKPKTDHRFGGSKDMADCVANCIWYLETYQPASTLSPTVIVRAF